MVSQGDIHLLKTCTAMDESEQSETNDQSNHNLRLSNYSESFAGRAYTSTNSDSDSDGPAESYLYETEVEYPLHLLQSLTMIKGSTTITGEAKASIILVVNLELSLAQ